MSYLLIACIIILILIVLHAFRSVDPRVKKLRLCYAIPSILSILASGWLIYLWIEYGSYNKIPIFEEYPVMMWIPLAVTLLCVVFYRAHKKKEALVQADLAGASIEQVRFQKHYERKAFDISSESLDEEKKQ